MQTRAASCAPAECPMTKIVFGSPPYSLAWSWTQRIALAMSPAISLMRDVGQEAVVGRDEDEALVHERLRLLLHVGLVARLPAAAVNPDDDRVVLALGRGVDIERLPLVLRLGVGEVTMDLRLLSESRGGKEQKSKDVSHGGQSP